MCGCVYLHEEARDQGFANVDVVVLASELCRCPFQVEPVHNTGKLLADVVTRFEGPIVDEIVVTPLRIF